MLLISFTSWWEALGSTEQIFWTVAIIASVIFVFQLVLTIIGLDADLEADFEGGDDLGIISIRSLVAFAAFFGWGGVAALAQGFSPAKAYMIAFLCGFLAMVALVYTLSQLFKLQESGTVDTLDAIATIGEVYLRIPEAKNGKGKIHINLRDKLMEFDAISNGAVIPTGSKIQVLDVLNENVMLVKAL